MQYGNAHPNRAGIWLFGNRLQQRNLAATAIMCVVAIGTLDGYRFFPGGTCNDSCPGFATRVFLDF
jgi:hypothetical protein